VGTKFAFGISCALKFVQSCDGDGDGNGARGGPLVIAHAVKRFGCIQDFAHHAAMRFRASVVSIAHAAMRRFCCIQPRMHIEYGCCNALQY